MPTMVKERIRQVHHTGIQLRPELQFAVKIKIELEPRLLPGLSAAGFDPK